MISSAAERVSKLEMNNIQILGLLNEAALRD
jgi:hypothetical protein